MRKIIGLIAVGLVLSVTGAKAQETSRRALAEELSGRYLEAYHDYKKVLELEPHYTAAEERLKDFTVIRKPAPDPG